MEEETELERLTAEMLADPPALITTPPSTPRSLSGVETDTPERSSEDIQDVTHREATTSHSMDRSKKERPTPNRKICGTATKNRKWRSQK